MSYEDFQGFGQIEHELIAQGLIAPPLPSPPTTNLSTDTGQSDPQSRNKIENRSKTVPEAIYGIFKTTQHGASAWNTHPAIRMVVEWLKKTLVDPNWEGQILNSVIFSSIAPTPGQLAEGQIDEERLKRGGVALLIKSIYNNRRDEDDNIQLDKCNNGIADLNSYIWDNKTSFLITWYRQNFDMWPANDTTYLKAYKAVLCSKAYKTLKQTQMSGGTWLDASLEMFHHFAKLAACGANDDQINEIYRELTTVTPILEGSTFGEIYENNWRKFEGWIAKGYLDFGDLDATHLDKWHYHHVMNLGTMPLQEYLAREIIQYYDYWHSAPSSSCFSASTRVLMASGESKAISEIKAGDIVSSPPVGAEKGRSGRAVVFVSTPRRAGRRLYELSTFSGIQFTETHPLLAATVDGKGDGPLPVLQFVNRLLAASLNPAWRSFDTVDIEPNQLLIHEATEEQQDELLYDLIFEPLPLEADTNAPEPLPVYSLQSSNGQQLDVLSEAPMIPWFPLEMVFIGNIIQAVSSSSTSFVDLTDKIKKNESSLQSLLRTLSGTNISQYAANAITEVTLSSLLLVHGDDGSQNASDLIEMLIIRLGRTISKEIFTGWLNPSTLSTSEVDVVDVLFVHMLHRLSDLNDGTSPIANTWNADIHVEDTPLPRTQLEGRTQGHNTLAIHDGIALPPRQQAATQAEQNTRSIKIELADASGEVMSIGGGPLQYGSQSILSVGNVAAEGSGYHAVLEVELRAVPRERFEKRHSWEHDERAMYAATLGYAFGLELLRMSANDEVQK